MAEHKENISIQAKDPEHKSAEHKPTEHRPEKSNVITQIKKHPLMAEFALILFIALVIGGFLYWQNLQSKIFIEKAEINAPIIAISPPVSGTIDKFYVSEGDQVSPGQRLAKVGDTILDAKTSGIITWIQNTPGQFASPQTPIIKMYDPQQLRVVGRIQEDKGLSELHAGQRVVFTVDAFGSKEYAGTLETIGVTPRQSDIVFSISDKREAREFEVKALFDYSNYSEIKNGMSAKMWVYK